MALIEPWKVRLYQSYVSTGQVRAARSDARAHYAPRASYIRGVIRRHFPKDRKAAILDLGCGDGAWLHFLQEAGYGNATGVDTSAEQIAQAHSLGVTNAQLGDMDELLRNIRSASISLVLLFDILEHLPPDECLQLLEEVRRVLAPDGRCVIHVPNGEGLFGMAVRYGDFTHERAFTSQSISQLLSAAGFKETRTFEDRPTVHGLKSSARRIIWELGTALPRLLSIAETGRTSCILSRNLLAVSAK